VHRVGREIESIARHDRGTARQHFSGLEQGRDKLLDALEDLRQEVLSSAC
jgi:hypothetical protein